MTGGVPLVGLAHKWGCTVTLRSCAGGLGGPWSGGALWPSGAVPGGLGGRGVGVHCGPQELCWEVWGPQSSGVGGRGFCHLSQPVAQNLVHTEFMISSL